MAHGEDASGHLRSQLQSLLAEVLFWGVFSMCLGLGFRAPLKGSRRVTRRDL